jgi:hypothetical protein
VASWLRRQGGATRNTTGSSLSFDPEGPEKTGARARVAYGNADFAAAFHLYAKAIDQLHDFYLFEQFRNRQPSPKDTWIVEGLTASLGAARQTNPEIEVREDVRMATHRLRTISSACDRAGASSVLYRSALDDLACYAPDVDVSDIFWK